MVPREPFDHWKELGRRTVVTHGTRNTHDLANVVRGGIFKSYNFLFVKGVGSRVAPQMGNLPAVKNISIFTANSSFDLSPEMWPGLDS